MKPKFIISSLLIFCLLIGEQTFSQSKKESVTRNRGDVSILLQEDGINILGKKLGFIYFEFTRTLRIKLNNQNGVDAYSNIDLPETHDPSYISQSPAIRNSGDFNLSRIKIISFAATRIREGAESMITCSPTEQDIKCVTNSNKFGSYMRYNFDLNGLAIGDEVEIVYSYSAPFDENIQKLLSFRLFPNSYYDIQEYQLKIAYDKDLVIDFEYNNGFTPDSSVVTDKNKVLSWRRSQLAGCMGEASARPYKSLPYVVFSVKPSEISYYIPNTFTSKALPGYFIPVCFREGNFHSIVVNVGNNVMMRDYPYIYDFVKKNLGETADDTIDYYKINKLQSVIVDKFVYDDNSKFFNDAYVTDPLFGKSVASEKIQEVSRYDFYVAWLGKLGVFFYSCYLTDVRSGSLTERYYAPMFSDDYLFAIQNEAGKVVFLYPKKNNFGFYTDEIPFYFEGVTSRLVCIEDYIDYRIPINEDFRHILTPSSKWSDNSRKSNVQFAVDIPSKKGKCNASVSVTGQFSTMTRGSYLSNYYDPTVNPLYAHKLWDVDPTAKLITSSVDVQQKNFPFKTTIKAEYELSNVIAAAGDSMYFLELKNLFPFIVSYDLGKHQRVLDFYSDFKGQDIMTYFFTFDGNIEIIENLEALKISNGFGEFLLQSELIGNNAIRVTSCLNINSDLTKASEIQNVIQIYDKIEALNNARIKIKLKT